MGSINNCHKHLVQNKYHNANKCILTLIILCFEGIGDDSSVQDESSLDGEDNEK